jgi:hypothetical protein
VVWRFTCFARTRAVENDFGLASHQEEKSKTPIQDDPQRSREAALTSFPQCIFDGLRTTREHGQQNTRRTIRAGSALVPSSGAWPKESQTSPQTRIGSSASGAPNRVAPFHRQDVMA